MKWITALAGLACLIAVSELLVPLPTRISSAPGWRWVRWYARMNLVAIASLIILLLLLQTAAHAAEEPWRATARQCAEQINANQCQAQGGGSCGGFYPEWARCTIARMGWRVDPSAVDTCIAWTRMKRQQTRACAACGDPVADIIECLHK